MQPLRLSQPVPDLVREKSIISNKDPAPVVADLSKVTQGTCAVAAPGVRLAAKRLARLQVIGIK